MEEYRGRSVVVRFDGAKETLAPNTAGCSSTSWVHLRLCLSCGHVGCCDSSPGKHATQHFHRTQHPVMKSFQPGEDWGWCFVDDLMIEPAPKPR
ncbi:MAG TPA: UBP-type zinc finger domain-containing protein [Burkholderiales bacterium]|nr:UBP-type zinc finger domain-containing protein [Burkholderiales bacterium]